MLSVLLLADDDEADGGRIVLKRLSIGLKDEAADDADAACVAEAVVVLPALVASAATTIAAATAAEVNDLNPDRTMVLIFTTAIIVSSFVRFNYGPRSFYSN